MNDTGSEDAVNPQMDNEQLPTMSEIYILLLADLSEAEGFVENARSHANENQPRQSWGALLKSLKRMNSNQSDVQTRSKKSMMEGLCKSVEDMAPLGEPLQSGHVSLELRSKLLDRVKKDRESIERMTSQLAQLQDVNKELERKTEELERIVTTRTTSGEMKKKFKLEEIGKRIKEHRARIVKDTRYVTAELCPDSYIQDILSEALKASQPGNDPYICIDEASPDDVEFLLRCNLISRNPHDPTLVRLRDLV
ncbi:uncharacterized protein LOC117639382 [Thrips palmi]|uniref:Uncharacterized protein LOC117639382 n=1 Tax=Thrips palmi TaxID=161013 RepID=A0A6P8ZGX7_THRPL|nr:uncharacterized protein LOC117639382 [Thrips palmi]